MSSIKHEHDMIMKTQQQNNESDDTKIDWSGSFNQLDTTAINFKEDSQYNQYKLNIPDDTKIDWSGAQTDWLNNKLYENPSDPNELKFSSYAEEYRYSEDTIIKELTQYIGSTYSSHYTNSNNSVQGLDIWKARGTMSDSCIDTSIKYLLRYGKKEGKNRKDLLKAAHYIILALGNERD